jgi:ABC-type sulfate transport system permease component
MFGLSGCEIYILVTIFLYCLFAMLFAVYAFIYCYEESHGKKWHWAKSYSYSFLTSILAGIIWPVIGTICFYTALKD